MSTEISFSPHRILDNSNGISQESYDVNVTVNGSAYTGQLNYSGYSSRFSDQLATVQGGQGKWDYSASNGVVTVPSGLSIPTGLYRSQYQPTNGGSYSNFDTIMVDDRSAINSGVSYSNNVIAVPPRGSYMLFESKDGNGNVVGYSRIDIETDDSPFGGYTMRFTKTSSQAYWNPGGGTNNVLRWCVDKQTVNGIDWLKAVGALGYTSQWADLGASQINVTYNNGLNSSTQGLMGGYDYSNMREGQYSAPNDMQMYYSILTPNLAIPNNLSTTPQTIIELVYGTASAEDAANGLIDLWHSEALKPTATNSALLMRYIEAGIYLNQSGTSNIPWSVTEDWTWRTDGLLSNITQWRDVTPLCWRESTYNCAPANGFYSTVDLIDSFIPDSSALSIQLKDPTTGSSGTNVTITNGNDYQLLVTCADGTPYSGFLELYTSGTTLLWQDIQTKPIYVSYGMVQVGPQAYGSNPTTITFKVRPYLMNSSLNSLFAVDNSKLIANASTASYSNDVTLTIQG